MNKFLLRLLAILCALTFTYLVRTWPEPLPLNAQNFISPNTMQKNNTVKTGDTIQVWYVGTLQDGTVFDTNKEDIAKNSGVYNPERKYEPLTFVVGAGQMIAGFDKGVIGMQKGETKTLSLKAKDAYGERVEELVKAFSGSLLDAQGAPRKDRKKGEAYLFQTGIGPRRGVIIEHNTDGIVVDFNHELAGKDLNFEVTIVDIQ